VYVGKLKAVPEEFVEAVVGGMYDVLARPDGPAEGVAIAMVEVDFVAELLGWAHSGARGSLEALTKLWGEVTVWIRMQQHFIHYMPFFNRTAAIYALRTLLIDL